MLQHVSLKAMTLFAAASHFFHTLRSPFSHIKKILFFYSDILKEACYLHVSALIRHFFREWFQKSVGDLSQESGSYLFFLVLKQRFWRPLNVIADVKTLVHLHGREERSSIL